MSLLINLRLVERENLELEGEIPAQDLDLEGVDELIKIEKPVKYRLEVQRMDKDILVQGSLSAILNCECGRCLKPFEYKLELPNWAALVPMEGDEAVTVVNDTVDLTPFVREDILLGFPQHPLCKAECGGLPKKAIGKPKKASGAGKTKNASSTWAELNKLKF